MRSARLACSLLLLLLTFVSNAQISLYVSLQGNDSWSGLLPSPNATNTDGPFATLERMKAYLRTLRRTTGVPYPVTVFMRGGVYRFNGAFVFESEDAGTATQTFTLRNYPGEVPYLRGSVPITGWGPVSDDIALQNIPAAAQPFVKQATLSGSILANLGSWSARGIPNTGVESPAELYDFQRPARLAQYPNRTAPYIVTNSQGSGFLTSAGLGARMQNWTYLPDAFVHGYIGVDWSDCQIPISGVTPSLDKILLGGTSYYGYKQSARFRIKNVLAELDQPGEYYLDRLRGLIFYYPVKKDGAINTELTQLATMPIMSVLGAPNLTLQGLVFEQCRRNALDIINSPNVNVIGCTIRNMGATAAYARTESVKFQSCDIYNIAGAGITITAGNRATLTSGNARVINCHFFNTGMTDYCFSPSLKMEGVGGVISGNSFHDNKHIALYFEGNDHQIINNTFTDCVTDTLDAGALYGGRDWTSRGNYIANNSFSNIYDRLIGTNNVAHHSETWAVYLDDCLSGTDIIGNLFTNVSSAAQIGGGRDNRYDNNIIYNLGFSNPFVGENLPSGFHIDSKLLTPGWDSTWNALNQRLLAVPYSGALYSSRYPHMANILQDEPRAAKYNSVKRNIYVGTQDFGQDVNWSWFTHNDEVTWSMMGMENNVFGTTDPGFVNAARGDFRISPGSPASTIGFTPINPKTMGLFIDQFRRGLLIHPGS